MTDATRIAVVRMLPGVGDLLCAVPALRAMRRAAPTAEVTFIGLPGSYWFADRFAAYIDRWAPCSSCPGLPESTPDDLAHARFMAAARAADFDIAVQMHGDGRATNAFTAALGANRWGGLCSVGTEVPGGTLVPVRPGRHEVERCFDAVAFLAVGDADGELEFPLTGTDHAAAARLVHPGRPLAVVHPGSSRPERRWPAARFAAVVDHLGSSVDRVVLTGTASRACGRGRGGVHRRHTDRQPRRTDLPRHPRRVDGTSEHRRRQ